MLPAVFARGVWKFGFLLQNSPFAVSTLEELLPNMSQAESGGDFCYRGTFWNESGSDVVHESQKWQANASCEVS